MARGRARARRRGHTDGNAAAAGGAHRAEGPIDAADAAMGRVSPNLSLAARSLGKDQGQTLRLVYFPMMRASIASALLLVFVDSVKELPATLLLRPFNYDTLATRVHEQASLENLGGAAPAAVLVILVGLCAVALLARANR